MELGLNEKYVFITASSDGIGRAIAYAFLVEGANVIVNGRDIFKLEKTVSEFSKKYGSHRVHGIVGDMAKKEDIKKIKDYITSKIGYLDILIGNLGTGKPVSTDKLDMAEWYHMYEYNLYSAVRLISSFEEVLKKQNNANIILLSSLAGYEKIGAPIAYAAAKNGIRSLVKYLADEYASCGIRVNGIAPGNVIYPGGRWEELLNIDKKGTREYIEKAVPMKRFGTPEEVANMAVFLASEKASFITGEIIKVDGGQSRST